MTGWNFQDCTVIANAGDYPSLPALLSPYAVNERFFR